MLDFFISLFFEIGIPILILLIILGGEYVLKRAGKRFWMWAVAAVWIVFVLWYRGTDNLGSWLLALGWLGVVAFIDQRVLDRRTGTVGTASASPSTRVLDGESKGDADRSRSVGRHGQ